MPVRICSRVTLAPTNTAPLGSLTVPRIEVELVWENNGRIPRKITLVTNAMRRIKTSRSRVLDRIYHIWGFCANHYQQQLLRETGKCNGLNDAAITASAPSALRGRTPRRPQAPRW